MDEKIINIIDETIKYIWMYDIPRDYKNKWLLREDTLKSAFYYYLRVKLGNLFEDNGIRIFTEFTRDIFVGTGFRPDMVIAKTDGDYSVQELLCVIEFKSKRGFTPSNDIIKDFEKLELYAKELNICKLYMATIWEYEDDPVSWIRKNAAWAKGRLTELNAAYKRDTRKMRFYMVLHENYPPEVIL